MIVCPVCAHSQQQGEACDNCGKVLSDLPVPEAPVTTMPELEANTFAGGGIDIPVAPMPELAEHRVGAVEVPPEAMPDLERTSIPDVGAVEGAIMPELEVTRLADDRERTALPQVRTCRYCGTVQASGLLCDGCGRAMPAIRRAEEDQPESGEDLVIACPSCGVKGQVGRRCLSCGSVIRTAEL